MILISLIVLVWFIHALYIVTSTRSHLGLTSYLRALTLSFTFGALTVAEVLLDRIQGLDLLYVEVKSALISAKEEMKRNVN